MARPVRDISAIFGDMPLLDGTESIELIDCNKLVPYSKHPFNEISNTKKQVLAKSILEEGVLNPIIVHMQNDGTYMILAGHKRTSANILAGNDKIPCIIKKGLSDAQQVAIVNKTNLTQTGLGDLTYMEQARAYKLEYETLLDEKKNIDGKFSDSRCTREFLAMQYGMTDSTLNRYLSLNKLIPEFQLMLDKNEIKFSIAVEISRLDNDTQKVLNKYILENNIKVSVKNYKCVLDMSQEGKTAKKELRTSKKEVSIKLKGDLTDIFNNYDKTIVEDKICKSVKFTQVILPNWLSNNGYKVNDDTLYEDVISLLDKFMKEFPIK